MTQIDLSRKIISIFILSFETIYLFGKKKHLYRELNLERKVKRSSVSCKDEQEKAEWYPAIKGNLIEMESVSIVPIIHGLCVISSLRPVAWDSRHGAFLELIVEDHFPVGVCF